MPESPTQFGAPLPERPREILTHDAAPCPIASDEPRNTGPGLAASAFPFQQKTSDLHLRPYVPPFTAAAPMRTLVEAPLFPGTVTTPFHSRVMANETKLDEVFTQA
jgi:hypothetical protein